MAVSMGPATATALPQLAFLGLGWIGRHRMRALADSGVAHIAAVADSAPECLAETRDMAPGATVVDNLDALLEARPDGLVIATPSALHAEQAIRALDCGIPVFCQKPLARSGQEAREVIASAEAHDCLLGVDFSYRYLHGIEQMRDRIRSGDLGDIYTLSLVFHNAYGPDKTWFYRRALAGGGCVVDLGIHLIDLALWLLDWPAVEEVTGRCFAGGQPLRLGSDDVEDYGTIRLDLDAGAAADIACSWRLPVGHDADIQIAAFGTQGGMAVKNVNGSFYNFRTELYRGTAVEVVCEPDEEGDWGGRAAVDWARRLGADRGFDPAIRHAVTVAEIIDRIYAAP